MKNTPKASKMRFSSIACSRLCLDSFCLSRQSLGDGCCFQHLSSVCKYMGPTILTWGLDLSSHSQLHNCSRLVSCIPSLKMKSCVCKNFCVDQKSPFNMKRRIKIMISKRTYSFYSRKKKRKQHNLNRVRIYLPYSTPVYSFVSFKDTRLGTLHENKPRITRHYGNH